MPYAVELYFDDALEAQVRAIWLAMAGAGVSRHLLDVGARPHLSLTCYEEIHQDALEEKMAFFARDTPPIPISLPYVGVFPSGFVFLGATPTLPLMTSHTLFHRAMRAFEEESFRLYRRGLYVPHCTLAAETPAAALCTAVEVALEFPLPLTGRLEQIALVEFPPTNELFVAPLA